LLWFRRLPRELLERFADGVHVPDDAVFGSDLYEWHRGRCLQLQRGQLPKQQYHELRRLRVQRRLVHDELQHVERYRVPLRLLLQRRVLLSHDPAHWPGLHRRVVMHEWVLRERVLLQHRVRRRVRRVQRDTGDVHGRRRWNDPELHLVRNLSLRGCHHLPDDLLQQFAMRVPAHVPE
jgi:hypothetical protein